jgi:glycerol-3-phosphate acyltransferase PlsY
MNTVDILFRTLLPFFAYALGSIPWGLVLTRRFTSVDIRSAGSGNIGATNVRRTAGALLGLLTLILDILKGYLPTAAAVALSGGPWQEAYAASVAMAAFLGHLYPLYMRGSGGGKGVATAGGCTAALSPTAAGWAVLVFLALVLGTRRVSVGSLAAAAVLPTALWAATGSAVLAVAGGLMAACIILRHRENIRRLLSGREPRL